jgi:serine/threonine-protein kinase
MPAVPLPGDVVAEKYTVSRVLGKGGMGVVVEAHHKKLGARVAIKFLMPDALATHDGVARFDREARASALLRSPYVVRVLDIDATKDGLPFIVMEYLEGHDIGAEIRSRGTIPLPEAVDLILQACIGLAEAHGRGIVHRDIKPANLYVCAEPTGKIVKVMDFGVSKLLDGHGEVDLTGTESAVGTPSYMAPEQLLSSRTIDHRADVWSLGVVLFRMLSGGLPFTGATPTALAIAIATEPPIHLSTLVPSLPMDLVDAVMKTLEKDPANRFVDIVELGRALEPFGTKRVAFGAAVAGMPPPRASRGSVVDPEEARATGTREGPVVDDMNAGTENAWAHRAAPNAAPPPKSHPPLFVMLGAAVVLLVGLVVTMALVFRHKAKPTVSTPAIAPLAASSEATPPEGAFAPPRAVFAPPSATAAPPTTSAASVSSTPPPSAPRPVHTATGPRGTGATRPTSPAGKASGAPPPPEDPLHL